MRVKSHLFERWSGGFALEVILRSDSKSLALLSVIKCRKSLFSWWILVAFKDFKGLDQASSIE